MQVRAIARYTGLPASKVRPIIDMVRGRMVDDAINLLRFTPSPKAKVVTKLIKSASANAENNYQMIPSDLRIVSIFADEATPMRRHLPRARGRVGQIRKRSSHITVIVSEQEG
jgi:large subunit ribosomal protein L22